MNHIPQSIYDRLLEKVLDDYRENYNKTSNVELFFVDLKFFNNKSVIGVRDSVTNSLLKLVLVLITYDSIPLNYNIGSPLEYGKLVKICEYDVTEVYRLIVQIEKDTESIINALESKIGGPFQKSKPWEIS